MELLLDFYIVLLGWLWCIIGGHVIIILLNQLLVLESFGWWLGSGYGVIVVI